MTRVRLAKPKRDMTLLRAILKAFVSDGDYWKLKQLEDWVHWMAGDGYNRAQVATTVMRLCECDLLKPAKGSKQKWRLVDNI